MKETTDNEVQKNYEALSIKYSAALSNAEYWKQQAGKYRKLFHSNIEIMKIYKRCCTALAALLVVGAIAIAIVVFAYV